MLQDYAGEEPLALSGDVIILPAQVEEVCGDDEEEAEEDLEYDPKQSEMSDEIRILPGEEEEEEEGEEEGEEESEHLVEE